MPSENEFSRFLSALLFISLVPIFNSSAQDSTATATPVPLAIDLSTGEIITDEEDFESVWPEGGVNIRLVNPIPLEDNSIKVLLDSNVISRFWVDDDDEFDWETPHLIHPVPGQEYVFHARSTGYLPVDITVLVEEGTSEIFIEMERDPTWIGVVQDAPSNLSPPLIPYRNGIAFGYNQPGRTPKDWVYYDVDAATTEALSDSPYSLTYVGLPDEMLAQLDVMQDDFGYHPVQILPSGNQVVFPRSDRQFVIVDLDTGETVELDVILLSHCCRAEFDKNSGYVIAWPDETQFIFRRKQIIRIDGGQVLHQPFWDFLGLDEEYRAYDIRVLDTSTDRNYLLLKATSLITPIPVIWLYNVNSTQLIDLGEASESTSSLIATWVNERAFIVANGYQVFEYDVFTDEKRFLLLDEEYEWQTARWSALDPNGEWLAVYRLWHPETGAGEAILLRWLDREE